jgi:hypothetical protein
LVLTKWILVLAQWCVERKRNSQHECSSKRSLYPSKKHTGFST